MGNPLELQPPSPLLRGSTSLQLHQPEGSSPLHPAEGQYHLADSCTSKGVSVQGLQWRSSCLLCLELLQKASVLCLSEALSSTILGKPKSPQHARRQAGDNLQI